MLSIDGYFDGNTIQVFNNVPAKKNQKVVITFLDEFVEESRNKTARGILSEFAKPDTENIEKLEKEAWKEAAEKKHENF